MLKQPDEKFLNLLRQTASTVPQEVTVAREQMAIAIRTPLREAVLAGDITGNIFEKKIVPRGGTTEYPVDFISPGSEGEFVAFTNPGHGRIPERAVQGDYVMVPTYSITNAIDWLLSYARDADWDIVGRALRVMEAGFVKKINNDAFHTILAAGVDRNILVYDADAAAGQFTKRFVSLMKVIMRRNAGGNSASVTRGQLTDLYLSPEGLEDIRNWGVDQVDDTTRREIHVSTDTGNITRIFGINLNPLDELGEAQEYQNYFTTQLSGALGPSSDVELVVGLDLVNRDAFVMPIKEELQIFPDPNLHRQQRDGYYGWMSYGCAQLDTRRTLLGSF